MSGILTVKKKKSSLGKSNKNKVVMCHPIKSVCINEQLKCSDMDVSEHD